MKKSLRQRVSIEVGEGELKISEMINYHYCFTEFIVVQSEGPISGEMGDYRTKCPALAAGGGVAWVYLSTHSVLVREPAANDRGSDRAPESLCLLP